MELSDILLNKGENYLSRFDKAMKRLDGDVTVSELSDAIGIFNYQVQQSYLKRKFFTDVRYTNAMAALNARLDDKYGPGIPLVLEDSSELVGAIARRMKISSRLDLLEDKILEYKKSMDPMKNIELSYAMVYLNNNTYLRRKMRKDHGLSERVSSIKDDINDIIHNYKDADKAAPLIHKEKLSLSERFNNTYNTLLQKARNSGSKIKGFLKSAYDTTKKIYLKIDEKPQYYIPTGIAVSALLHYSGLLAPLTKAIRYIIFR